MLLALRRVHNLNCFNKGGRKIFDSGWGYERGGSVAVTEVNPFGRLLYLFRVEIDQFWDIQYRENSSVRGIHWQAKPSLKCSF